MNSRVVEASVCFTPRAFIAPLVLSSGRIEALTEATATVRVRSGALEATGRGSMLLSDLWAWPGASPDHAEKDRQLQAVCLRIAGELDRLLGCESMHPLELGLRLHAAVGDDPGLPDLAAAMCASPFDAALHDAAGRLAGCSAFDLYAEAVPIPSADTWFPGRGAVAAIRDLVAGRPRTVLDAWWIVGGHDALEAGSPFARAVQMNGYRCFKIKLSGRDPAADARLTAAVYRAALALGAASPRLSGDSNEGNDGVAGVRDYLDRLQRDDREACAALEYLEQPTSRDIVAHPFDGRAIGGLKPVLLDEGLTSLERLPLAIEQGWGGLALKTCKGHSFALTAAAWAADHNLPVALQDLTNPGFAAIHAGWFAARVPTLNGVELNSPQFIPAANAAWRPRLDGFFSVRDGVHRLAGLDPVGLGSRS